MYKVYFNLIALMATLGCRAQSDFRFQQGDLIFQINGHSAYTEAIRRVTTGIDQLEFTHVGVICIEEGKIFVLEAIPYGVVKSPLEKFMRNSLQIEGKPAVVIGRLKPRFRELIPPAIDRIKQLLGRHYDFIFCPNDENYYCSELIHATYLRPNHKPLFKAKPMSFRDKETGETCPLWNNHFKRFKAPIPEGIPGTNPADMSRSKKIAIVYRYF